MAAKDTVEELFNFGVLGEAFLCYRSPEKALRLIGEASVRASTKLEIETELDLSNQQNFEIQQYGPVQTDQHPAD